MTIDVIASARTDQTAIPATTPAGVAGDLLLAYVQRNNTSIDTVSTPWTIAVDIVGNDESAQVAYAYADGATAYAYPFDANGATAQFQWIQLRGDGAQLILPALMADRFVFTSSGTVISLPAVADLQRDARIFAIVGSRASQTASKFETTIETDGFTSIRARSGGVLAHDSVISTNIVTAFAARDYSGFNETNGALGIALQVAPTGMAAPTPGTITTADWAAAYPLNCSFAHDATGGEALVVTLTSAGSYAWDPSASYNGVAMTLLTRFNSASGQGTTWVWGLANPASGSHDVVISKADQYTDYGAAAAINLSGVDTADPFGAVDADGGSGAVTLSLVTTAADSLVLTVAHNHFTSAGGLKFTGDASAATWQNDVLISGAANHQQYGRALSESVSGSTVSVTATAPFNVVTGAMIEILAGGGGGGGPETVTSDPTRLSGKGRSAAAGLARSTGVARASGIGGVASAASLSVPLGIRLPGVGDFRASAIVTGASAARLAGKGDVAGQASTIVPLQGRFAGRGRVEASPRLVVSGSGRLEAAGATLVAFPEGEGGVIVALRLTAGGSARVRAITEVPAGALRLTGVMRHATQARLLVPSPSARLAGQGGTDARGAPLVLVQARLVAIGRGDGSPGPVATLGAARLGGAGEAELEATLRVAAFARLEGFGLLRFGRELVLAGELPLLEAMLLAGELGPALLSGALGPLALRGELGPLKVRGE